MANQDERNAVAAVKSAIVDAIRHIGSDDIGGTHRAATSLGQALERVRELDALCSLKAPSDGDSNG